MIEKSIGKRQKMASPFMPTPSHRAVQAALFGLRKDAPFTDEEIEEHFALLCLPILGRETNAPRRTRLFREVLRLAVADLEPRFRTMAEHLLLPTTDKPLASRRAAAIEQMRKEDSDWVEDWKPTTLERRALMTLAEVLLSSQFTAKHSEALEFTTTPLLEEDTLGFRWVTATQALLVESDDPGAYIWRYRFEIEASQNNLRIFSFDYHWSGTDTNEPPTPFLLGDDPRQTHLGVHAEDQVGQEWMVHYIHLGRTLARGQKATVAFEIVLRDDDGSSEPYNVLLPRFDGVEELQFECKFLDSRKVEVRRSTWDIKEMTPVEYPIGSLGPRPDGSYYHSVKAPTRGVAYGIAWVDLPIRQADNE